MALRSNDAHELIRASELRREMLVSLELGGNAIGNEVKSRVLLFIIAEVLQRRAQRRKDELPHHHEHFAQEDRIACIS